MVTKTPAVMVVLLACGCGGGQGGKSILPPTPPPITTSYRPSALGVGMGGMVLKITNASDKPLHKITLLSTANDVKDQKREFVVADTLQPHKTIELGVWELDGWMQKPGYLNRITCHGFSGSIEERVPKER